MKYSIYTLFLGLLILSACGKVNEKSTTTQSTPPTAVIANTCSNHAIGESFLSEDGCNTCSCESGGVMMCTQMACLPGSMIMQAGAGH